jgi:two-component system phosphate regulon sensor histidine kinase PhoR
MLSRTWVRIALSYVALVLITAGVLAALLGGEYEGREENALRNRLTDQARAVAHDAAKLLSSNAPENATNALAHDMASLFGTRVTLIRPDGVVVGDSEEDPTRMENHATRPEVAQALSQPSAVGSSTRVSATVHRPLLYVAIAVTSPGTAEVLGVARVAYPLTAVEQARNTLLMNAVLAVLLVSIPAALLGVLLVRSIVGPLSSLREAARRFGQGDLEARSGVTTGGEIGDLNREFNSMAHRLGDTIEQRTAERNRMAAVLTNMHDGVITTDERGLVDSMNPAASQLLNVSQEKAAGHSLIEVTRSHELHQALLELLSRSGEYRRMELQMGNRTVAAVVTVAPASMSSSVSTSGAENKPAGLLVLQDITELRRLERVRRDFVANIGHELRTPLTSIKLLVETVRGAMHDDTQVAEDFLGQMEAELDRLTQLVRELLELSRIESGQVELHRTIVDAPQLLEEVAGRLRAQAVRAGVKLTVETGDSLPPIYADGERIEQVLVNLVHNAIKFTNPGGSVTLGAEGDSSDGEVRISVRDTGVGIPPDDLPRIFERFYKVDKARAGSRDRRDGLGSEGGTGLGLAIAKHVVQAHGGRIWAESVYGQGSTFCFTLPNAASAATSSR